MTTVTGSTTTPTFTITTQPARGTASISGTTLTYTPAANDFTTTAAPLTLVYQAAIGSNNDTGTITIAIASVNDAPVVGADAARSTTVNTPLTVAISSLLANDNPGPANEGQTVTLASTPVPSATNGTVAVSGGNLVFTPNTGYTGPAVISYSITDGVASAAATLSVNVNATAVVTVTAANGSLSFAEDGAAKTLNFNFADHGHEQHNGTYVRHYDPTGSRHRQPKWFDDYLHACRERFHHHRLTASVGVFGDRRQC